LIITKSGESPKDLSEVEAFFAKSDPPNVFASQHLVDTPFVHAGGQAAQ